MRNLLVGLVIAIVVAVFLLRGDQLIELAETVQHASMIPLLAAVCTQLGKYFSQSYAYTYCFKAVGEHMPPRATLPLVFGTFFMNTIAPSLNLAGTTLVVDDARRRGIEPGKATSAALLMQLTIDSAFMCIMIIAFAVLAVTVGLDPGWFALGLIVLFVVSCMAGLLVLGRMRPQALVRVLTPIESLINRLFVKLKKKPMNPWVEHTVASFSDAAGMIVANPKETARAFGQSIIASCCELACFCLVGIGFGVTSAQPLVCGYVVATLFAMVSITPQGVGVVEAAVTVAFTAFGSTAAAGVAIGLVYRSIVFWMPFLIGAVLIQRTKTFKGEKLTRVEVAAEAGAAAGLSAGGGVAADAVVAGAVAAGASTAAGEVALAPAEAGSGERG
ncbi:MAG: lysylphosphatidylglycerol synthase transmembrane domain-containing protein [Coriobacteriia bacterium]|nr:lysylphosphatidylglycerol synthase transmembrane domain-containing protein [Coriobacteriia bacterium]